MVNNFRLLIRFRIFAVILIFIFCSSSGSKAQVSGTHPLSMDEAVTMALSHNPQARNAEFQVRMAALLQQPSLLSDPISVSYSFGSSVAGSKNQLLEISQSFGSPLTALQKSRYNKGAVRLSQAEQSLVTNRLIALTKAAYTDWLFQRVKLRLIARTTDLVNLFIDSTGLPVGRSDTVYLERLSLETAYAALQNQHFQAEQDYTIATHQLELLLFNGDHFQPNDTTMELYALKSLRLGSDKFYPAKTMQFYQERADLQKSQESIARSEFYPGFKLGYFNWNVSGYYHLQGVKVGMTLPLWFFPQKDKVRSARILSEMAVNDMHDQEFTLGLTIENLKIQLDKLFVYISFYRENALRLVDLQDETAVKALSEQQTSYRLFLDQMSKSLATKLDYLVKVKEYNQTAIQLEYYIN